MNDERTTAIFGPGRSQEGTWGIPRYWPHDWEKPSSVYFIGSDKGPVKIGVAIKPKHRLYQLQVSSPHKLTLLATMAGSYEQERYLHTLFKRERLHGEWFRPSKRVRALIARLNPPTFGENWRVAG